MKNKLGLILSLFFHFIIIGFAIRFSGHLDSLEILSLGLCLIILAQLVILALFVIFKALRLKQLGIILIIDLVIIGSFYIFHKSYDSSNCPRVVLWGLNGEDNNKLIDFIDKTQIDSIVLIDFYSGKLDSMTNLQTSRIVRFYPFNNTLFFDNLLQAKTFKPLIYKNIPSCRLYVYSKNNRIDTINFSLRAFKYKNQYFITDFDFYNKWIKNNL
jgi:hypothetical protein